MTPGRCKHISGGVRCVLEETHLSTCFYPEVKTPENSAEFHAWPKYQLVDWIEARCGPDDEVEPPRWKALRDRNRLDLVELCRQMWDDLEYANRQRARHEAEAAVKAAIRQAAMEHIRNNRRYKRSPHAPRVG